MTFLVIGIIGFVLLVGSLVLDGMFDFDGLDVFDNGILSTISIATFLSTFGFIGFAFYSNDVAMPETIGLSLCGGLVTGALIGFATKFLRSNEQEAGTFAASSLLGNKGVLLDGINDGNYGTVSLSFNGMTNNYGALSEENLPKGTHVEVVRVLSSSSVLVKKIEN